MANRNHMLMVPPDPFARAVWLEEHMDVVLRTIEMDSGLERFAELEAQLFPRRRVLPLDPKCPECGHETEDGSVERSGDAFRVIYDCGHVLELSAAELESRLHGRNA